MTRDDIEFKADVESAVRSLCHDVRGLLSRLHLRIELAALADGDKQAALNEVQEIDTMLGMHRDLVRTRPTRARSTVLVAELVRLTLPADHHDIELDASLNEAVQVWPEVLQGIIRALAHYARSVCPRPLRLALHKGVSQWTLTFSGQAPNAVVAKDEAAEAAFGTGPMTDLRIAVAHHLAAMLDADIVLMEHPQHFEMRCCGRESH